ncbi:MAG: hypothetical protein LBH34_04320, partial [Prevotellaceae bacterium]|nr:hypothetical protein [Prevotellaceae bacterium]
MITKIIVGLTICTLGTLILSMAQNKQPVGNPMGEPMELIFNDEFYVTSVNWDKWESRQYAQWDKNDCARGPENLEVVDGELRLNVKIENRKINERRTAKWTSGYIYSKYIVEPNTYMEARFKPGQCPGVNNAFWTACVKHQGGKISNRYEIDIVETRQDIREKGNQGRGHLAWHDWKSYGEYTNSKGEKDHIAQGYHVEHDFTGYNIWGLWYGENELIYFLNGKEVGRGDYHPRYTDQWSTGVGKFEEWNPTHEKETYGKFGQDDWNYNGGM